MITVVRVLQVCILWILLPVFAYTQDLVLQHSIELKGGLNDSREAYPIINETTGEICLILMDSRGINALLLNAGMQVQKQLTLPASVVQKKLDNPVGSFWTGNKFVMVSDERLGSSRYFSFLEINFAEEKMLFPERMKVAFPEGDELLSTFSENGKFYALSVVKKLPAVRLYVMDKIGVPVITAFDLPEVALSKKHKDLHAYLRKDDIEYTPFQLIPGNPSGGSLASAVFRHKVYYQGNNILLTIDKVNDGTNMLFLDVENGKARFQRVDYPKINCTVLNKDEIKENSFVFENQLFQIRTCPSSASINITDYSTGTVSKSLKFTGRDKIDFRNGPFIFRKDKKEKELANATEFLAKLGEANRDPAIAVRNAADGQIEMTIGGQVVLEKTGPTWGGGGFAPGFGGMPIGGTPLFYGFNPTYGIVETTVKANTIFFKSFFNKTSLEHQMGEPAPLAYDKLQEAKKQQFNEKEFKAETVFYFKNAFYFGTYNKDTKQFSIYRYAD